MKPSDGRRALYHRDMSRLRNRLTYANVVATLALVIALGTGSAFAASVIITKSSQVKNGVITNAKIKRGTVQADRLTASARASLRGATGPAGPAGPQGDPGTPGEPGTSGSTAPALLLASSVPNNAGDSFIGVSGNQFGSEPGAQSVVPQGTGLVARDLTVQVQTAPGDGNAYTIAFRVDGADGLSCTITGAATSCSSGTATAALAGGALINYKVTASGTLPVSNRMGFGVRVVF